MKRASTFIAEKVAMGNYGAACRVNRCQRHCGIVYKNHIGNYSRRDIDDSTSQIGIIYPGKIRNDAIGKQTARYANLRLKAQRKSSLNMSMVIR